MTAPAPPPAAGHDRSPSASAPASPSSSSVPEPVPDGVADLARAARSVTVLTGAGMSAESGVPTFRDAQTGLWARYDPEQLATPQAWRRDRELVWAWYAWRAALVRRVRPNAGHDALAQWAALPNRRLTIATQNVDDLHERAGSEVRAHVHGSLFAFRCERCAAPYDTDAIDLPDPDDPPPRREPPACPRCQHPVRPGVVWFGEALPEREFAAATDACRDTDLVLVVGTSGIVYPFAALPGVAARHGVPVVEINPVDTALTPDVDHAWRATAANALPALVAALRV
jgi:NAD-dependent deacetylase